MSSSWTQHQLGEVLSIKHGWAFKGSHFTEDSADLPIVVAIGNFRYEGGFRIGSTKVKRYTGDYPPGYELAAGDILLAMTCQTPGGEILGIPGRIPDDAETYLHNQRLGLVELSSPDLIDTDYLYWLFRSAHFNRHLVATASGTKILHTAPSRIESYVFDLPPLDEQRRIAEVLGALDNKIELNRKMNQTLEEMAQAIFKSWFIDFDGVPASDLVDSPLGPIPKGWRVGTLGELVTILDNRRVPLSRIQREARPGPYPYHGATSVMDYVDGFLFDGVYVLVGEDGSVSDALGRPVTQYVWGQFWVNNHAHVLEPQPPMAVEHLLLLLRNLNVRPFITGAVQPKLSQRNLKRIPVVVPDRSSCDRFREVVAPLYRRLRAGSDETRTLADLRDTLLPRLISGELRVPAAEEEAHG